MEKQNSSTSIVLQFGKFALIGFLVLVLGPPILSIALTLLPFVVVGAIVYGVVHVGRNGLPVNWRGHVSACRQRLEPVRIRVHQFASKARVRCKSCGAVLLDALAGGCIGAMLGLIGGMNFHDFATRIPVGFLAGAGIGALASSTRKRTAPQQG